MNQLTGNGFKSWIIIEYLQVESSVFNGERILLGFCQPKLFWVLLAVDLVVPHVDW